MWNKEKKEKKPAFTYLLELISRQDYSKSRLKDKLLRKEYSEEETEAALKKLEELRLLNDKETAKSQFRFLYEGSKNSVKEIKYKLLRRGFSREDIEEAVPETNEERELSAAIKALNIKFRKNKDLMKMRSYLYRHGFSGDICRRAVNEFLEEK